jgi:hypothetical protein
MSDIEVTGSMADPGKKKTFIVVFEVEAKAVGKMRNEARPDDQPGQRCGVRVRHR